VQIAALFGRRRVDAVCRLRQEVAHHAIVIVGMSRRDRLRTRLSLRLVRVPMRAMPAGVGMRVTVAMRVTVTLGRCTCDVRVVHVRMPDRRAHHCGEIRRQRERLQKRRS
jgi:hypothetical protein